VQWLYISKGIGMEASEGRRKGEKKYRGKARVPW